MTGSAETAGLPAPDGLGTGHSANLPVWPCVRDGRDALRSLGA